MSLGFDHGEPNKPNRSYRPPVTPTSASQMTPRPAPREFLLHPDDLSNAPSQMFAAPYAPSPSGASTFTSVPPDGEAYGLERYSGHADFPEYAASTPRPQPSAGFNPVPFMTGLQTDSLVQRDFKDELTRAAGTVTPGVSDAPYIRYAIDAITGRHSVDYSGADANASSDSDTGRVSRSQIIPQFSVRVSRLQSGHQPLVDDFTDAETAPNDWPSQFPAPDSPGAERRALISERQPDREPVGEQVRGAARDPGREPAVEPARPPRTRIDELVEDFNRAKALVLESMSGPPPKNHHPPRTAAVWRALPDSISRQDLEMIGFRYPPPSPLIHKPWVLRSRSLLLFAALCFLMIVALVISAVYSIGRDGFTPYAGTIYGGQYFLFRVLPQLIGAVLLIYAQCIVAAMLRIFPFSAMASDDRRERRNAVFLPLYPKSFLWPQLFGPWNVWVPTLVVWLANFTLPLLSCLYTVVFVDDVWKWAAVQGVAWTLVAVYVSLLLSTVSLFVYWRRRHTGMIRAWDIRSIADVLFLVSQSNSLPQYWGLETAESRGAMKTALDGTAERLGYWATPGFPQNTVFFSMGVPTTEEDLEVEKWDKKNWAAQRDGSRAAAFGDAEKQEPWAVRSRYLPWCFRNGPIVSFVAIGAILLIALIVVSFLPATDIRNGFLPGLSAAPGPGAFSPADFLYSFLPSLIGLALFLAFQSLDLTLRVLQPWGELAREEGSRAEKSLLLDYAACLPWESTFKAVKHRHWRVAFITFLSPLFALIPVLSGGLFMALTPPSGTVRMYPNVPILAVLLTLLVLYLAALATLVPQRKQFRLPHAVTCLAEIISFCSSEQLRTDEAFEQSGVHRRDDLEGMFDLGKDWHRQGRWTFGAGKNNDERLGIKRYSKYTVNSSSLRQYDRYVRGKPISGPLLHGSGPLFGN